MGFAIARAAREAGADVFLVAAGPVHLPTPRGVRRLDVKSAQNMLEAVEGQAQGATLFIATAAVADWRVASQSTEKIKKDGSGQPPALNFVENPTSWPAWPNRPAPSLGRCTAWALPLKATICWPMPLRSVCARVCRCWWATLAPPLFGQDDNALLLVDEQGHRELPHASKRALAQQLVAEIARRLPR